MSVRSDSSTLLSLLFFAVACEAPADKPGNDPGAKPTKQVTEEQQVATPTKAAPNALPAPSSSASLAASRGVYGAGEMRFNACVAKESDRTLKGTNCGTGFMLYGPYATIPANSDVEVLFEVQAEKEIFLTTDFVSEIGKQFHAGINEQIVEAGATRWIGYRARFAGGTTAVEARVFVRTESPASFSINDFALTVRAVQ